jgi:hypothetical protein
MKKETTITFTRDHGLVIGLGIAKEKNEILIFLPFTVLTFTLHSKTPRALN